MPTPNRTGKPAVTNPAPPVTEAGFGPSTPLFPLRLDDAPIKGTLAQFLPTRKSHDCEAL